MEERNVREIVHSNLCMLTQSDKLPVAILRSVYITSNPSTAIGGFSFFIDLMERIIDIHLMVVNLFNNFRSGFFVFESLFIKQAVTFPFRDGVVCCAPGNDADAPDGAVSPPRKANPPQQQ